MHTDCYQCEIFECFIVLNLLGFPLCSSRACAYQRQQQNGVGAAATGVVGGGGGGGGAAAASRRSTTVLLLDEIGLAEHSPDMPLKVLHKMLPEEKIAIVGTFVDRMVRRLII